MKRYQYRQIALCTAVGAGAAAAQADTLAEWTFEVSLPFGDNTQSVGPYAAEGGLNGPSSFAYGWHSRTQTDYSNPVGNGSNESFSSNEWSVGDYYEFTTSTLGYKDITFGWDQTRSGTGPTTFDLEWSVDGLNYFTLVDDYTVLNNANPPGVWNVNNRIADYIFGPEAAPASLDNQAIVYFRLTNQLAPGGNAGTNRVDNVIIQGTLIPGPGAAALLGIASAVAGRRRR